MYGKAIGSDAWMTVHNPQMNAAEVHFGCTKSRNVKRLCRRQRKVENMYLSSKTTAEPQSTVST